MYLTCHPEDFEIYFDKISARIFEDIDCTIWYSYTEETYTDIETNLGKMNLFVIPVTTKLLTTNNHTMEFDLPFALKHNIPILPLMQENGLDDLYYKTFGDLQYFNLNDKESKEKFKRYIFSVLLRDGLDDEIRKSFDAYIFLSYRKKDRKYALELMRSIHNNDFCRNIAIWYDEFLVPGENFSSAIEHFLKKSALFAMVVTPNLVNEENYVHEKEYPLAIENGKKILPAEFEKTDKSMLDEMYTLIPDCIDAKDDKLLSKNLMESLDEIIELESDREPKHNYYIGLAYLLGIDVEINEVYANQFLQKSAECGFNDGALWLGNMYREGIRVSKNDRKAVYWYEIYLNGIRDDDISETDLESIMDARRTSKTEKDRYDEAKTIVDICSYVISFYKENNSFDSTVCESIASICEKLLNQGYCWSPSFNRFTPIIGYEHYKNANGVWQVGKEIYGEEYVLTGLLPSTELFGVIHALVTDNRCLNKCELKTQLMLTSVNIIGKMKKAITSDERYTVSKFLGSLFSSVFRHAIEYYELLGDLSYKDANDLTSTLQVTLHYYRCRELICEMISSNEWFWDTNSKDFYRKCVLPRISSKIDTCYKKL